MPRKSIMLSPIKEKTVSIEYDNDADVNISEVKVNIITRQIDIIILIMQIICR